MDKQLNRSHSNPKKFDVFNMVGRSPAMNTLYENIISASSTNTNVLIFGETGTGKEMVANAIHSKSSRADQPFIPIDCTSLSESIIESELFGYEKGAYTGADKQTIGLLESAHLGIVFFDEITKFPLKFQAKLLRVIQERKVRRVGSKNLVAIDVKIISATNMIPQKAVDDGFLLPDLYYRLNVLPIHVPRLQDREADSITLSEYFLKHYCDIFQKEYKPLSPDVKEILMNYHWPGNVRELKNLMESMVVASNGKTCVRYDEILNRMTPQFNNKNRDIFDLPFREAKKKLISDFEKEYFSKLLNASEGNITLTSKKAQIDRRSLQRILKNHKLNRSISSNPSFR